MVRLEIDQMYVAVFFLACALSFLAPYALSQTGPDVNYRNVTVTTQLNITNSNPEVLSVVSPASVTLNAGSTKTIVCNTTVRDYDGIATVSVNGTFYDADVTSLLSADDNNNHYTNASCTRFQNDSTTGNFTCSFQVQYYANSGNNWNCTIQATDDKNITGTGFNTTTIQQLLALNVTPGTIDYGNLDVGDISSITQANVTNFGNAQINVTVRGFGSTEGDNLAMTCAFNNIPVNEERFSLNSTDIWASMTVLSSSDQNITNLTLVQRTNDAGGGEVINSTYWRIRVPASSNPSGQCTGNIVFQAELA